MAVQQVTRKTYLQILQDAMFEAGVQQRVPTSINDADGLVPRFKKWVNLEWIKLQRDRDFWDWRRNQTEFTLTEGNSTYDFKTLQPSEDILPFVSDCGEKFILARDLTQTVVNSTGVNPSSSGSTVTMTSTDQNLPTLAVGQIVTVTGVSASSYNTEYRVTGQVPLRMVTTDGSSPSGIVSGESVTFTYVDGDTDQFRVRYVHWNDWRGTHERLVLKDPGRPTEFTIDEDDQIIFNRPADKDYGIDIDYVEAVTEMTADADEPTMPVEAQDILQWAVVEQYGRWDQNAAVIDYGARNYREVKKYMDEEYLRPMRFRSKSLHSDYD